MQLQAIAENIGEASLPVSGHVGRQRAVGVAYGVVKYATAIAVDTANNNEGYAIGHKDILDALPTKDNDGVVNGVETTNNDESARHVTVSELVSEGTVAEPGTEPTAFVNEVFVVEKIIEHRIKNCTVMFKVKWKGYPDSDNTWEYGDKLNCKDLIQEYEDKANTDRFFDAIKSGLVPEKVIGVKNTTGQMKMAVKW